MCYTSCRYITATLFVAHFVDTRAESVCDNQVMFNSFKKFLQRIYIVEFSTNWIILTNMTTEGVRRLNERSKSQRQAH
jgi:hypothetical protein